MKVKDVTTDLIGIKMIIREYYQQLYINKWDSLDETDKFLGTHKVPKLSRSMSSKEIEPVFKNLTKKSSGTSEFYQTCKDLILALSRLFQIIQEEEHFLICSIKPELPWQQRQRHHKNQKL